jgi:hypothetical protein
MRGTAIFCWPSDVVLDRRWGRFRVTLGVAIDGARDKESFLVREHHEGMIGPRLDILYLLYTLI